MKHPLFFLVILLGVYGIYACSKGKDVSKVSEPKELPKANLATVVTLDMQSVSTREAMAGGKINANGGGSVTERGMVLSTTPAPTIAHKKYATSSISGDGSFTSLLTELSASTRYYIRAYAINAAGTAYGNEVSFTTSAVGAARFEVEPLFIIGSTRAYWDVKPVSDGGDPITERGVCWSLTENPTVSDQVSTDPGQGTGRFRIGLMDLQPKTQYYVRAYAKNKSGISYSDNVKFSTIAKGRLTYTINKAPYPNAEEKAAYDRLQFAIDSAVWYVNTYTSVEKHVWINYDPGVQTADATDGGWIRFGANQGYQQLRTMLHELNHAFGTGTTGFWWSTVTGGKYQKGFANAILNKIQNTTTESIHGDGMHWWPYGLNYDSEVSSSWDYIYNCLIIEQMRRDGLDAAGQWTP